MTPPLPAGIAGLHLDRLRARFGDGLGPPTALPDGIGLVFLCFTNRSGSNHLAELLAASGQLNLAAEVLNHDELAGLADRTGLASVAQCLAALMRWNAVDGRFAAKLATTHLPVLHEAGLLAACLPRARFVLIERQDKLDQAISFEIARQTGRWAAFQAPARPEAAAEFSAARIAAHQRHFIRQHRQFEAFFTTNAIAPVRVTYEALCRDPQRELSRVAAALGLAPPPAAPAQPRFTRQAGTLNAAWRARFLAAPGQQGQT